MANKIEIFENTLLKLLVRRGLDADRRNVVLEEGELGYTTDTKKLYVGDGQTFGGQSVGGNIFWGTTPSTTILVGAGQNDIAFSTSDNTLYSLSGADPSDSGDWTAIGGIYTKGNNTIVIDSSNRVTVGTISAANITGDILGTNLTLTNTNRITLSSQIAVNSIIPLTGTALTLPSNLTINNTTYAWPQNPTFQATSFLRADITGSLSWQPFVSVDTTTFVYNSAGLIPVGSIMPFVSAGSAPSGWLLCNGQSVAGASFKELSAVIGTTFGGDNINFNVPNFINKTLYGVGGSPASSTLYSVSSGFNSSLSATGALFIIKAKPDEVIRTSATYMSPLSVTVDGQDLTNSSFNPLSGDIVVSLEPTLTGTTTVLGPFIADEYGRVTDGSLDEAATLYIPSPGERPIYNGTCSPIGFFERPVTIATGSSNSINNTTFTISAYPYVTDNTGSVIGNGTTTSYSIPPNAKNLIVDCILDRQHNIPGVNVRIIAAAPNTSYLLSPNGDTIGDNEFVISYVKTFDYNDDASSYNQVTIPLSAKDTGDLVAAFRVNNSLVEDVFKIRVLGYTL